MKNFRKVLALILVVATLFSFVAMASAKSATEYTDYADVTYVEAVDVLTALGIINGYDGAFHPADTIDRDEMAKMIAVLRNAGDFDADLFAPANKFADAEGSWAEGYIAYCAQLGIINGLNATTFAPDAAVKVVEVAKMLLCTLGFDAQKQGYVGANWNVAVLRDATKYGLIPADVNPYEAATRDQAAQMFLNALTCDLVAGYVSENIVYVTNSLYANEDVVNNEVIFSNISLKEAEKAGWEVAYGNAVVSTTPLYSIYANLKVVDGYDCYDRPGYVWTLTDKYGKVLFSKFYKDAPYASTTTSSATAVVDAALALKKTTKATQVDLFVDGQPIADGATFKTKVGNGSLIETFIDGTTIRVCAQNTYIGKVTAVNTTYGTFEITTDADVFTFAMTDEEVAVKDIVLFYLCDGSLEGTAANKWATQPVIVLHDVAVVEPVVASVTYGRENLISGTTANVNTSYVIADGKTYNYNFNYANNVQADFVKSFAPNAGVGQEAWANANKVKFDLYLDAYGNLMYWTVHEDETVYTYAYLVEGTAKHVATGTLANGNPADGATTNTCADTATLVKFADAAGALTAAEAQKVSHKMYQMMVDMNTVGTVSNGAYVGRLMRYVENADGTITYEQNGTYNAAFAPAGARITKGSNVIVDNMGASIGIYTDNTTKFMVRTMNADGTYSYNEYVGYNNIPQTYVAETVAHGATAFGTNIQYFVSEKNAQFVTHVFIDAKYTTAAASNFMLISVAQYNAFDVAAYPFYAAEYTAYNALVDGVKAVVLVDNTMTGSIRYGVLYGNTLEYLGLTLANDGGLPLYAQAKSKAPVYGDTVALGGGIYTDATGAKFVPVVVESDIVYRPLSADAKLFTINYQDLTDDDVSNATVNVFETEAAFNDIAGGSSPYGYVVWNAAGTEVVAVYRIVTSYHVLPGVGPASAAGGVVVG